MSGGRPSRRVATDLGAAARDMARAACPVAALAMLLALFLAATLAPSLAEAGTMAPTASTHTGPWYEPGAPETSSLWSPGDPGQALHLRGVVLDTDGQPVGSALVELWHTDSTGSYPPLRASVRAGTDGRFGIRTVLPGHNHGYRARHIHFVVSAPMHRRLVTRIYFRGDPNIAEAPWPELAIVIEQGTVDDAPALFGSVQFVLER